MGPPCPCLSFSRGDNSRIRSPQVPQSCLTKLSKSLAANIQVEAGGRQTLVKKFVGILRNVLLSKTDISFVLCGNFLKCKLLVKSITIRYNNPQLSEDVKQFI